jgi:hypothetical protein
LEYNREDIASQLREWINEAKIKEDLDVHYDLSWANRNSAYDTGIYLSHNNDTDSLEATVKHEIGHIKFKDTCDTDFINKHIEQSKAHSLISLQHFQEYRADQYMARKSIHNARIMEQKRAKDILDNSIYIQESKTHPNTYDRFKQVSTIRKLLESEKNYLHAEWYRREYDRAFYKTALSYPPSRT